MPQCKTQSPSKLGCANRFRMVKLTPTMVMHIMFLVCAMVSH
jgi:hypothetical protein